MSEATYHRIAELTRLLDEFDRYASVPDDTGYVGSPFQARVKATLGSTPVDEVSIEDIPAIADEAAKAHGCAHCRGWVQRTGYLSTACLHDLHSRCRKVCKFCPSPCRCSCHACCPTCHNEGVVERLATPEEVDEGCELGIAYDPCPNERWHNTWAAS